MKLLAIGGVTIIALIIALAAVAAVFTAVMTRRIEARHPPAGRFVAVSGGRLHLVDRRPVDREPDGTIVLLHGASGAQGDMMVTLGARLVDRYRVIAIDRPGHGWSDRPGGRADAAPARQAALIHEALMAAGVEHAVVVGHSFAGSVATRLTLDYPQTVSGLMLLAPATHPWPGGVAWYYTPATTPVLGDVFAHTVAMPLGLAVLDTAINAVFAPQRAPAAYAEEAGARLVLRPREFLANAEDVKDLLGYVREQAHRYGAIKAPTVIITGDVDKIVSPQIHSAALAREIPGAKLIVLPGVGHVPQWAAPDLVAREIDRLAQRVETAAP
jgi:pimeloyl-ACP methyl ester carboxylesterase